MNSFGCSAFNDMDYLTIALPKGKLFSLSADLLAKARLYGRGVSDKSRKLVITNGKKNPLYRL